MREPNQREIDKFEKACKFLLELTEEGYHLHMDGGTLHLMSEAPHGEAGPIESTAIYASSQISATAAEDRCGR